MFLKNIFSFYPFVSWHIVLTLPSAWCLKQLVTKSLRWTGGHLCKGHLSWGGPLTYLGPSMFPQGHFSWRGTFDSGEIFFLVMQMSRKVGDRKIRKKKNGTKNQDFPCPNWISKTYVICFFHAAFFYFISNIWFLDGPLFRWQTLRAHAKRVRGLNQLSTAKRPVSNRWNDGQSLLFVRQTQFCECVSTKYTWL